MSQLEPSGERLRVGHADRDRVIEILRDAAAEGRITLEELDERIEAAAAAKFADDLRALIADLPAGVGTVSSPIVPANPVVPAAPVVAGVPMQRSGYSPQDPLTLTAGWSTIKREGQWDIPPWIVINPQWGTVIVNCLQARSPADGVVTIEVLASWGTTRIIVPEGWGCDHDRLQVGWGSKKIQLPMTAAAGQPLIRLVGTIGSGSLIVRNGKWWD